MQSWFLKHLGRVFPVYKNPIPLQRDQDSVLSKPSMLDNINTEDFLGYVMVFNRLSLRDFVNVPSGILAMMMMRKKRI